MQKKRRDGTDIVVHVISNLICSIVLRHCGPEYYDFIVKRRSGLTVGHILCRPSLV